MFLRVLPRSLRGFRVNKGSGFYQTLARSTTPQRNILLVTSQVIHRRRYASSVTAGHTANDMANKGREQRVSTDTQIPDNMSLQQVDTQDKTFLKVVWNDGMMSRFPYIFLREICKCSDCFEPSSKQKKIDLFLHGLTNVTAHRAEITPDGSQLVCYWSDNEHKSIYPASFLYERRIPEAEKTTTSSSSSEIVNKDLILWDKSKMQDNIPQFDFTSFMQDDKTVFDCLYTFYRHGLVLVNGSPPKVGVVEDFAARIGYMQSTHYGNVFEVQTKADPSNLAYTSEYLPFHIDLPFMTQTPDVQSFHCIEQAPENGGGENIFVDAFMVAKKLLEVDPEAFHVLSKTPVLFGDVGTDVFGEFDMGISSPVIVLNARNRLQRIKMNSRVRKDRWNNLSPEELVEYYKNYLTFLKMFYRPEYNIQHRLQPGQIIVFQNTRVLHSRNKVTDMQTTRWLRGYYHDWDTVFSRLRSLHSKLGLKSPHIHEDTNDFF